MGYGPYERTGLAVDAMLEEPAHRRGPGPLPLKPRAWNEVTLAIEGDTVRVSLNGELVYERPIESTNDRHFGLFHFRDKSEARVRGVVYRGSWGETVPAELLGEAPAAP
jgi:hypothetical protein